jgi:UDP-glucose 4-epimerase
MIGRLLVTGASGFIGRHLVNAFAGSGISIKAATRQIGLIFSPPVEVAKLPDLASPIDWTAMLEGVDAVVHLAGIAHASSLIDPAIYDRVNGTATAELAAACAKASIRLVFLSSIRAQSGPSADQVVTERDAPKPSDAYGRSKLLAENAIRAAGVQSVILRPALVYGPGVKGNLAALLRLVNSPWPLPFAAFHNRRSMVGIDNLTAAIRLGLDTSAMAGGTYIVADPNPPTFAGIVAALRSGLGRRPGLFAVPPELFAAGLMMLGRGDLWQRLGGELVADPGKLLEAGWRPPVSTREGLAAMARAKT